MNETHDTFTSSIACYSSIQDYGANGKVQPIMNPYPATVLTKVHDNLHSRDIQHFHSYGSCFKKRV